MILKLTENIKIALNSIRDNLLRTIITIAIIAIGITALVGMLTAIDGLESAINSSFSQLGANTFNIRENSSAMLVSGKVDIKKSEKINYFEAESFKNEFKFPGKTAISAFVDYQAVIKSDYANTNPNNRVIAIDEDYLEISSSEIKYGRNFSEFEIRKGASVAIVGKDIANALFQSNAVDSMISYQGVKYKIIGVLKEKGGSLGFGGEDRIVYIPVNNARSLFLSTNTSYVIMGNVKDGSLLKLVAGEAESAMRKIRKLNPNQESNFEVSISNSTTERLMNNIKVLTLSATIISLITLIGASIGLMNIMLVSVTERTREIGTRIALGARAKNILFQFLTEAIVICIIGGIAGIILGIGIGNIVSVMMSTGFIVPWKWIALALVICIVVGLVSGIYPARKASKLNPIDALRYE